MRERTVEFMWSYASNELNGWRQRIGMALRHTANRIDGRITLAIDMQTLPVLPESQRANIIRLGQKRMCELLAEAVRNEASERVLQEMRPELYEDRM